jgi:hypothetical protein
MHDPQTSGAALAQSWQQVPQSPLGIGLSLETNIAGLSID